MLYGIGLIHLNSCRTAIRFLNCLLKYITVAFESSSERRFKVMQKAQEKVAHKKERIFSELTRGNCRCLRSREFGGIVVRLGRSREERLLWVK